MRSVVLVFLGAVCLSCGGGGGSSNNAPAPPPVPPTAIAVLDALPSASANMVDANTGRAALAHLSYADLDLADQSDCTRTLTIARQLVDVSDPEQSRLLDHKYNCSGLSQNSSVEFSLTGSRTDGSDYEVSSGFATATASTAGLVSQDSVGVTQAEIQAVFLNYLASQLLADLDLPPAVALVLGGAIINLANEWVQLQNPGPIYNVVAERMSYLSADPNGNAADTATGLVVWPDVGGASFTPKSSVVILAHATGSTPSDLDPTNAWFMTALVLASRGYVVIAPDNWGRGGTATDAETYLLANRTAANAIDLLEQALTAPQWQDLLPTDPSATIVGYSQGGHSAVAIWQNLLAHQVIQVDRVFAGGGPYDLYQTFRGVVEFVDGSCSGGVYCRYVDEETTLPFVTERVLPGLLAYTNTGLVESDITTGGVIESAFVDDFLADQSRIDALKGILQLSSFSNITNLAELTAGAGSEFILYHSNFDRLVPAANNDALTAVLSGQVAVDDRSALCNTATYQTIFNTTAIVGISHALCGFAMIDDVLTELP